MNKLLLIFLLVGCGSLETGKKIETKPVLALNENIRQEANGIDSIVQDAIDSKQVDNLAQVKPKTDKIRMNTVEVDSIIFDLQRYMENDANEKAELVQQIKELENKTSFRTYLPWVILFLGIAIAVLGRFMFNSIGATIAGGLMASASVGVHQYYDLIAKFELFILFIFIIYAVFMFIIKKEQIEKETKNDIM